MKLLLMILILGCLMSCGSEQPTGELSSCTGQYSVTEDRYDIAWSTVQGLGMGSRVGQYVRLRTDVIAKEMMLRTISVNATSIRVSIYKGRLGDTMGSENPPLKVFTVTGGLSIDNDFHMWLQLPEPFEFHALTDAEVADNLYYFITIEPLGGSLSFWLSTRDTASRVRQGIRWATNSDPPWHPTDTSQSLGIGFRGESGCQTQIK